jgi:hypothetical protein
MALQDQPTIDVQVNFDKEATKWLYGELLLEEFSSDLPKYGMGRHERAAVTESIMSTIRCCMRELTEVDT